MRTPKERAALGIEDTTRQPTPVTNGDGPAAMRFGRRATDPPVIPSSSSLFAMQGVGRLGQCLGCGRPAATHLGHKGEFKGCPNVLLPPNSTFALVPLVATEQGGLEMAPTIAEGARQTLHTRRASDSSNDAPRVGQVERRAAPVSADPAPIRPDGSKLRSATPFKITRFVYAPVDRRKTLKGDLATPAMLDAYGALVKSKKPLTAQDAAKKAKRPQEANRRCLNLLVENGLVEKSPLDE